MDRETTDRLKFFLFWTSLFCFALSVLFVRFFSVPYFILTVCYLLMLPQKDRGED